MNIDVKEFIPKFEHLTTWTQMQDYLAEMQSCVAQMEAACTRLQQLKDTTEPLIEAFFFEAKCEELEREAATTIYWGYDFIDASTVRNAACGAGFLKSSLSSMKEWVYPISVATRCFHCKEQIESLAYSRSKLAEYSKGSGYPICDGCQRKREEEANKRTQGWEERQQAEQQLIQELRSMPYREYLQTEHWQLLRASALKRANYRCELCYSNGELHVHHKTYEHRGYEYKSDLIVLCKDCHAKFHNKLAEEQQ